MKLRYLYCALLGMMMASNAMAWNEKFSPAAGAWFEIIEGFSTFGNAGYGDFIMHGALGKNKSPGTWDDEGAIVAYVAMEVVEHGGYFCPLQIQCANKNKNKFKKSSWFNYFKPDGFSYDKCLWLCEEGYAGKTCAPQTVLVDGMDEVINKTGLLSDLSVKKSGKDNGMISSQVNILDKYDGKYGTGEYKKKTEKVIVLGAVEFKRHGVKVTPVSMKCQRDGYKSYVESVATYSSYPHTLLCAEGYTPNLDKSECIELTQEMLEEVKMITGTSGMTDKQMCAGWTEEGYDSVIHSLDATGVCAKYMCKDKTKAFAASGNFECAECASSIRSGQDPLTGLCVKCEQVGQYFDTKTGECKSAMAFTRIDMQYGKGKTKETNTKLENQCWTKVTPEEYKDCVYGKSLPLSSHVKPSNVKLGNFKVSNVKLSSSVPVSQWNGTSVSSTNSSGTSFTYKPSTLNQNTSLTISPVSTSISTSVKL